MIDLHFTKSGKGCPLIILHGLYGSGSNWHSFGKALSSHFTVYLIDLRNHGLSPHHAVLSYGAMTADLKHFMDSEDIETACIMGHSMGGKVAMNFTLLYPDRIQKLIVIDIALRSYMKEFQDSQSLPSRIHEKIVGALTTLDLDFIETREEADKQLARLLPQRAIRQFLLKNLKRNKQGQLYWGLNIIAIRDNLESLLAEIESEGKSFDKPVLVISGNKSGYINDQDKSEFRKSFPGVQIEDIDAGHWVHSEQAELLMEILMKFLTVS